MRYIGITEPRAQLRCFATRQKDPACLFGLLHLGFFFYPVRLNDFGYGIAMFGIVDCGREQFSPRQAAKLLVCLAPSVHRARNSDAVNDFPVHGGTSLSRSNL